MSEKKPYRWDSKSKRYRDPKGRYISQKNIRQLLDVAIDTKEVSLLTRAYKQGNISKDVWHEGMQKAVKKAYAQAGMLAKGGKNALSAKDRQAMGANAAEQFYYLDGKPDSFLDSIDGLTEKQAIARARMYVESSRQQFEEFMRDNKVELGAVWEKWVLGAKEHCTGCLELAAMGMVSIGTLGTVPGAGTTPCLTNCGCRIAYYSKSRRTLLERLGGPGSGYRGHAGGTGGPGKPGGSQPRGGSIASGKITIGTEGGTYWDIPGNSKDKLPEEFVAGDYGIILVHPKTGRVIVTDANIFHADLAEARKISPQKYDEYVRSYMFKDFLSFNTDMSGGLFSGIPSEKDASAERNLRRAAGVLIKKGFSENIPIRWELAGGGELDLTLRDLGPLLSEHSALIDEYTELPISLVLQSLQGAFSYFEELNMIVFDVPQGHLAAKLACPNRDKCMRCPKPPTIEVRWAEGMGHAWFCDEHYAKWENREDVNVEKKVLHGIARRDWNGLSPKSLTEPYEYDGAYHFFGGPGSGHWGHAGRAATKERGGSLPRSVAMSLKTGKDWEKRQARVKDPWGAEIKFYTPQGVLPGWDAATPKEQELFLQALDKLPDDVKQMWRGDNSDITLMVGEDKYSAKHMGNFIFIPRDSLDPDLGGVPRHEFAHHIAYQEYMRTQYSSYNPPELFNHAKIGYNRELRINEHLTMMLDSFDPDPKVWARNLLKPVPIEAGLTESLADSQVSAATSFLKGIGAL